MKRLGLLLAALGLLGIGVAPVLADEGGTDTVTIMIMKHVCTEADISTPADFDAVEAAGAGEFGTPTGLVQTVLACPTTGLPGDAPSDGIAAPRMDYGFTVTDSKGGSWTLADGTFEVGKLCEKDLELDANGDGEISTTVCLDISHYAISGVASGEVTVTENQPPSGFVHGTVRFTPDVIDGNNDADSLLGGRNDEPIRLDTSNDEDGMVMLHVYNFEAGQPQTDTISDSGSSSNALPFGALLMVLVGALGVRFLSRAQSRP